MWNYIFQHTPILYLSQNVWRDEAYSILIAQKPVSTYFHLSFEPPLYYTLLHFWIKIFGTGEIAVRCLSLLGFFIAVFFIIRWSDKLFSTKWLAWYLPLLFTFNPMLLYYAFEARSYAWYMAFIVMTCYFYFEKNWLWYCISLILGLYTHVYIAFVPVVLGIYQLINRKGQKKISISAFFSDPFIKSMILIIVLYIPWIYRIFSDIPRLSHSWYYPVDLQLFKSVLGNIFLGYEGTPWYLWNFTYKVSILLFITSILSIVMARDKKKVSFFFLLVYLPLSVILLFSLKKPLFVMRYMIPSTIAEIFLIAFMIDGVKSRLVQKGISAVILISCVGFSIWYAPYHAKPPIKNIIEQINSLQQKNDVLLVDDALTLYEAMYYNTGPSQIYWYNPDEDNFPWYIGDYIVQPSQIVSELPAYPSRGFLIHNDGTYELTYNFPMMRMKTLKK